MAESIRVEVVYALPQRQELVQVSLPEGATVRGIFAKLTKGDATLRDRDRVEIYRPLIADPKAVRKKRADEGKVMKKGGGPAEESAA